MAPETFSQRSRSAQLRALGAEPFDILVIGGGITGAGIAREAALRGFRVALVEQRDFAYGTSSRSSKLIHGGLRYLEQRDLGLVREAASERAVLRRLAPYLVRPIQMLVPVSSRAGHAKLRLGLWTYHRLAGVGRSEKYRMLSRQETLDREPVLRPEAIYGAGVYYEYLTDDARLVMAAIKQAAALGALVLNYAPVTRLIVEGGRVRGAEVSDALGEQGVRVRAQVVVNAAGPWVDHVRTLAGNGERRLHLTKGIHFVLPSWRLPLRQVVVMRARDRRSVFAVPRGEAVYVGTTDTDYQGPLDCPAVTSEDVLYLLEALGRTFAVPPIGLRDITAAWAGLRPLLHEEGKRPSEISRKDEIMVGASGLISVAGGKLTTFRKMAERVLALAADLLRDQGVQPSRPPRGRSDSEPLAGGETGSDVGAFAARLAARWPGVPRDSVDHLVELYGSEAERIAAKIAAEPALGVRLAGGSPLTRGEVEYLVREELAETVEDILERRTRALLFQPDNGLALAPAVADAMGHCLGWDERRIAAEVEQYRAAVHNCRAIVPAAPSERAAHG